MDSSQELSIDLIIQYSIVGLILLAACGWIIWKLFRKQKKGSVSSCCGCSLSDTCNKKIITKKTSNHGNP